MKKAIRTLVVMALALCLSQAAALAADPVSVQINGEDIQFTYAAPQIVEGRTFLPVRAVFEQMGAEVSYDNGVVTATRDGRTVTMTIGSTEASVTENGSTAPLAMDVAPFIDPALGSTYVPVRFAAEALGAGVGWDADSRTVLILDAEKETASLLEGRSFTWMDKLLDYSKKYNSGIWNSDMTVTGSVKVDMSEPENGLSLAFDVPVTVQMNTVTQDAEKMEAKVLVKADLASVRAALEKDMEAEEAASLAAIVDSLAENGISCDLRCDLTTGKLYCIADLSALGGMEAMAGLESDTWYMLDMGAIYAEQGISLEELTAAARSLSMRDVLELALTPALSDASLDDTQSYAALHNAMSTLVNFLSDDGFKRSGDACVSEWSVEDDGAAFKISLSLALKGEEVSGYAMDMSLTGVEAEVGAVEVTCRAAVDDKDAVSGAVVLNVGELLQSSFELSGSYQQGSAAPATEPPAGAEIINPLEA